MKSAVLAALLLAGCSTPDPVYRFRCPDLVDYPPEVQAKAADEIEAMPEGSVLPGFIADYGLLRRQCRTIGQKNAAI